MKIDADPTEPVGSYAPFVSNHALQMDRVSSALGPTFFSNNMIHTLGSRCSLAEDSISFIGM